MEKVGNPLRCVIFSGKFLIKDSGPWMEPFPVKEAESNEDQLRRNDS